MELKGKAVKKIKPEKLQKMNKTLDTMKTTRAKYNANLKKTIEEKHKWALEEIEKGELQIQAIKIQLAKLTGIILFAEDLLEGKK